MMLTKNQANWLYFAVFNNILHVPYGQRGGFMYDYVGGKTDECKSRCLANVHKMARGGHVPQAQKLLDAVFTID